MPKPPKPSVATPSDCMNVMPQDATLEILMQLRRMAKGSTRSASAAQNKVMELVVLRPDLAYASYPVERPLRPALAPLVDEAEKTESEVEDEVENPKGKPEKKAKMSTEKAVDDGSFKPLKPKTEAGKVRTPKVTAKKVLQKSSTSPVKQAGFVAKLSAAKAKTAKNAKESTAKESVSKGSFAAKMKAKLQAAKTQAAKASDAKKPTKSSAAKKTTNVAMKKAIKQPNDNVKKAIGSMGRKLLRKHLVKKKKLKVKKKETKKKTEKKVPPQEATKEKRASSDSKKKQLKNATKKAAKMLRNHSAKAKGKDAAAKKKTLPPTTEAWKKTTLGGKNVVPRDKEAVRTFRRYLFDNDTWRCAICGKDDYRLARNLYCKFCGNDILIFYSQGRLPTRGWKTIARNKRWREMVRKSSLKKRRQFIKEQTA